MTSQPPPLLALPDPGEGEELEVEHTVVMSEVSEIVEVLEDMDL